MITEAKSELWRLLFNEAPPAAFDEGQDRDLRDAFLRDCESRTLELSSCGAEPLRARHYLTLNPDDGPVALDDPRVLGALRQDLGLPVINIEQSADRRWLQVGEERLQQLIKQSLARLEELDQPDDFDHD